MKQATYIKLFIIILILAIVGNVYAYRTARPIKFTDLTKPDQISQLNDIITELWNISNGRWNMNIVTVNPDGNTKGDVGDMLLYNSSGTYYLEINTTGAKIWRGVVLTDTP